ncbi:uncharacterized protein LOC131155337 [Malania oleifera]|uniref:uncharacterized protein LOC131155337 n=1 Tax=Malania oleifera TaxID=397392 RepID=UPI0025AEBF0F|nr:uncharacterized protein LOC131155337 [Malania oleifera]
MVRLIMVQFPIEGSDQSNYRRVEAGSSASMAKEASSSSTGPDHQFVSEEEEFVYGAESGWVEARTQCDHLGSLFSDLSHIPTPATPCNRCDNPAENWLCLCCKDVFCSRFVNKHMLEHYQQQNHCLALSYSDLSIWCFSCDAYLDAQVLLQLRPVYETAYILKFGESPPFRSVEYLGEEDKQADTSSSRS